MTVETPARTVRNAVPVAKPITNGIAGLLSRPANDVKLGLAEVTVSSSS